MSNAELVDWGDDLLGTPALGERLLLAMRRAGLTQRELAARLHTDPRVLRRYLSGERTPPKEIVEAWERECGLRPGTLMDGSGVSHEGGNPSLQSSPTAVVESESAVLKGPSVALRTSVRTDRRQELRHRWPLLVVCSLVFAAVGSWWAWRSTRSTARPYLLTSLASFEKRPALITVDREGTLWFTVQYGDSIWKLSRAKTPTRVRALEPGSHPFGIMAAPDGSIWFTEGEADGTSGDAVSRLHPDGTLAHRTTLPKGSEPTGLAIAEDGRVWVTAYGQKAVYWVSPDGQKIGGPFHVEGNPNRIIVGPDRNIWITIATQPRIVVLSSDGAFVRDYLVVPNPTDIVVRQDGQVWITSYDSNALQRIDPYSGQVFQPREVLGGPGALAAGPDGNLWFTQLGGRAVSAMSPEGEILRTIRIREGTPFGIANGPDDAIWFTVQGVSGGTPDSIGRIPLSK